ncbi:MAG: hypothetical protein R3E89_11980 [Thiolinea sp.]
MNKWTVWSLGLIGWLGSMAGVQAADVQVAVASNFHPTDASDC